MQDDKWDRVLHISQPWLTNIGGATLAVAATVTVIAVAILTTTDKPVEPELWVIDAVSAGTALVCYVILGLLSWRFWTR